MARHGAISVDVRLLPVFEALGGAHCSQCGGSWGDSACGPTHALIKHRRLNEPVFTFTDPTPERAAADELTRLWDGPDYLPEGKS